MQNVGAVEGGVQAFIAKEARRTLLDGFVRLVLRSMVRFEVLGFWVCRGFGGRLELVCYAMLLRLAPHSQ